MTSKKQIRKVGRPAQKIRVTSTGTPSPALAAAFVRLLAKIITTSR